MARRLTPNDCHALINELCIQATGQAPEIAAVDTSTFVSVGETILATGIENTLNALSMLIGRTFMAARPYNSKFRLIDEIDTELFRVRTRKISFYSKYALASGAFNTDLYTNFADGFTNGQNIDGNGNPQSTPSMYYIDQPKILEMNFGGFTTWQDSVPVYRDQLKDAFTSESNFSDFMSGLLTEKANDIEIQKESFRRMTLLNHLGGVYALSEDYPTMALNLTAAYNAKFGTSYTSEELRTTYLKSFLEFMVATIKTLSRRMEYRTAAFHIPHTVTENDVEYNVLRHTPRDRQRLFLYSPLIVDAEAQVMPEIFNTNYLDLDRQFESVDYWQNFNDPAKVVVKPAIPGNDGTQTATDSAVTIPYVVGCLFDTDALVTNTYLEDALSSPIEARKRYYTMWWTFAKGAVSDYSENFILFYMDDTEPAPTADKIDLKSYSWNVEGEIIISADVIGDNYDSFVAIPLDIASDVAFDDGIFDIALSETPTPGDVITIQIIGLDENGMILATSNTINVTVPTE